MDKLKLWLIPGIIVIIAIGGLVFLRGRTPDVEPVEVVEVEEEVKKPKGFAKPKEPYAEEKLASDSAAMATALRSGSISDCEAITWDEKLKQECIDNLTYVASLRSGDEAECQKIQDEALKQQCLDRAYLNAAVDETNLASCDQIADEAIKTLCTNQVQTLLARNADDLSACDNIESSVFKEDCQDSYHLKSSMEERSVEGCQNIKDNNLKDQCVSTIENNIAIAEANKIATKEAKASKTPQELLDVCNTLSGDMATRCKDSVYPKLALEEKDISHCDKISDSDNIAECKADTTQVLDQYYLREATSNGDILICDKISSEAVQTTCKSSI